MVALPVPSLTYDPRKPHLVVGAHLDTVPGTQGANDDASGVGMLIELQHLTAMFSPEIPVEFVIFGAEERRRQSKTQSQFAIGSRAFLSSLPAYERKAIAGALILDMVAVGSRVHVLGKGGALLAGALQRARALKIDAFPDTSQYFSDHVSFQERNIPVVWFYSGDDPAFHTPRDSVAHLQRAEVDRIGRLAWDLILHAREYV
jgi:Zn-dependent M28 family amino/carboxypeptidase